MIEENSNALKFDPANSELVIAVTGVDTNDEPPTLSRNYWANYNSREQTT